MAGAGWFGDGFYATPIEPVDEDSLDEVIAECFRGRRTPAEVSWVLVLRERCLEYAFEESPDSRHWLIPAPPLERIWLSDLLEEVRRYRHGKWERVWLNEDL